MSQVSNTLLRIGDQFRRGFESRGDAAMQGAEFGLKKAGLERQSRLDALALPGAKLEQARSQRGLDQVARLKEAFNPMEIMSGGLGPFTMGVSADKDGVPGIERAGRYAFGAKYDPEKNVYLKEDGSVVTNEEARSAAPKFQEWFAMNFSPYRGARTNRDEMALKLKELGPDHPDAPAVQKKIQEYIALMKNPEWKLQALEKTRALVEKLPDDPFGEKTNNLARIDKEIGIVKGEYNSIIQRQNELADAQTKHDRAKELKNLEITSMDKRAELGRKNAMDVANIRAGARTGASDDKFNKSEVEYQDNLVKNKIFGQFGIQLDMDGNPTGQVTKSQLDQMNQLARQEGYEVYAAPGKKVDKPGLFTGDEQMYQIIGINRSNMPGRGGALGQPQPGQGNAADQPAAEPRQGTDGNFYVPDPSRPGKHLRVDPDEVPQTEDVVAAHTPRVRGMSVYETATAPPPSSQRTFAGAAPGAGPSGPGGENLGEAPVPAQRSMGAQANIDALKRGSAEAVNIIKQLAIAIGGGYPKESDLADAAQMAADAAGIPVDQLLAQDVPTITKVAQSVIAQQAEARKGAGNIQPYGFR